jgi:filamentous hemagglutinin family protein
MGWPEKFGAWCGSWLIGTGAALAGVVSDGTLSASHAPVTLGGPLYNIPSSLGTIAGANLFESFSTFNLVSGEFAVFEGPAGLQNIVARVTGGPSSINGAIVTSTPAGTTPSLWLVNPAGITFGPNAQINVAGSLLVSTADYIRFADGTTFASNPATGSSVTAASPEAFGFLGGSSATIAFSGSRLGLHAGTGFVAVAPQIALASGAVVSGTAAAMMLATPASAGEVTVATAASTATTYGVLTITGNSQLNASGPGGGMIRIRSGQLELVTGGEIVDQNTSGPANGSVTITAASVTATGDAVNSTTGIFAGGTGGDGVPLSVSTTGDITLNTGATLNGNTFGAGRGSDLTVTADNLTLAGNGTLVSTLGSSTSSGSSGNAGAVTVTAGGSVSLIDGGELDAVTQGTGSGGNVSVTAQSLTVSGALSNIASNSEGAASGPAGSVVVSVPGGPITIADGLISSFTRGSSPGGTVTVSAGQITISGYPSGIQASTSGTGAAGIVSVSANSIAISNGGEIGSNTFGPGPAGSVGVEAGSIILTSGGSIGSATEGSGAGGVTTINATASFAASGQAADVGCPNAVCPSGALAFGTGPGAGGTIEVTAPLVSLAGGGAITTQATGTGAAGSIQVTAGSVDVDGGTISSSTSGAGAGGSVAIDAGSLIVSYDGAITTSSTGTGVAGPIAVLANTVRLIEQGVISTQSSVASAGDIVVTGTSLIELDFGSITTSVAGGKGNGGNIFLDPEAVVLDDGTVIANALRGNGGNITIASDVFIENLGSVVSASSALGISGTITIESPSTDVTAGLVQLSSKTGNIAALARADCSMAGAKNEPSSLNLTGRGALAIDTEDEQPALYFAGRAGPVDVTADKAQPLAVHLATAAPSQSGCR